MLIGNQVDVLDAANRAGLAAVSCHNVRLVTDSHRDSITYHVIDNDRSQDEGKKL